jgi:hypothetical protein
MPVFQRPPWIGRALPNAAAPRDHEDDGNKNGIGKIHPFAANKEPDDAGQIKADKEQCECNKATGQ